MNIEQTANDIADSAVIEFTKDIVMSPEEAFRLNQVVFRVASEILSNVNKPIEEVTA